MTFTGDRLRLYAVTDSRWLATDSLSERETLETAVENVLLGGATLVQLRDKRAGKGALLRQAQRLLSICHRCDVPLIINDYPDVAREAGADGVHVGQEDMAYEEARRILGPDSIIGVSAHNPEEALRAQAAGADYLGCGAVFGSATKEGVQTLTPTGLKAICEAVTIPVVAIGGIDESNILELCGTGADGVAVVSALFAQTDKEAAARRMRALAERMVQGG